MSNDFFALVEKYKKKNRNSNSGNITVQSSAKEGDEDFWGLVEKYKMQNLPGGAAKDFLQSTVTRDDDIGPVKEEKEEEKERSWFQSGVFEDGYQFGDINRALTGTLKDVRENLVSGVLGIGESVVDAGAYLVGGAGKLLGADEFADKTKAFIAKELVDEEKVAKKIVGATSLAVFDPTRGYETDDISFLGEKSDALVQSGGQLAGTIGLQAVGVPWYLTTGLTSFGGEAESAFKQDATYGEAGLSAAISAGAEILTEKISGGIKFGGKALDDTLTREIARNISNKTVRTLTKLGMDATGEGIEEVLSGVMSAIGQKITYADDKELSELFSREDAWEAFVGGAVLGGGMGSINAKRAKNAGVDYTTGLTENEQKVVDKVYQDEIAGKDLSQREKAKIYDEVLERMDKGYIDTDTIESVLGDKTSLDSLQKEADEFNTLYNTESGKLSKAQQDRLAQLEEKNKKSPYKKLLETEKGKFSQSVQELVSGSRLAESYNEKARRGQDFQADMEKYKGTKHEDAAKKTLENAIKAGANNTNRVHDLVDMAAKTSADTGISFSFKSGQQIKDDFVARQTKEIAKLEQMEKRTEAQDQKLEKLKDLLQKVQSGKVKVNGDITADGIVLNLDSKKPLNRIVGHEITHSLEKAKSYKALHDSLFAYAKTKGIDIDAELETRRMQYEGVTNADPEAELVADLVGDFLFTDSQYIQRLSTENRNVFQKIWDEIKYLAKVATRGSQEARELARVQKAFEDAYRQSAEKNTAEGGAKYALKSKTQPGRLDPRTVTKKDVVELLSKVEEGSIYGNTYIPVRIGTPSKLIYWAQKRRGDVIDNNPIAISADKAYNAMYRSGETESGRPNSLSADEIVAMIEAMNDPRYIVYQGANDRYVEVVEFNTKTGDKAFAVIEIGNNKDAVYMNGYEGGLYNILVTTYPPRAGKIKELLSSSSNQVIYDKTKDASQRTSGSNVPSVLNDASFYEESIPDNSSDVKAQYSLSDSEGRQLSPAVQKRFGKSKVVDEDGNLKPVFHGTASGEFTIFDKSKGSVEGDFGSGFYFTDNGADVSAHYEGGGPDFDNKVARRAEQIEQEEDIDYDEALERAKAELFKGSHKFEVYLNIENPAIVGETMLLDSESYMEQYNEDDYDDYDDYIADVEQLVADDIENIVWEVEKNVDVYSTEGLANVLYEAYYEGGIGIEELKAKINDLYLEDSEGNLVGNEVARQIIESLGYDGIIDPTVSGKWNMDIEEGTTHYIVFKPNQIKAVTNENPTDNPDIRYSLSEEYAPTFYSQMAKVIDGVKQDKLGAASVVSMLRGKGVKAEEIKWSGIEQFLEGKKSVTKEELQEFIKGSQLQIEETVLGEKPFSYTEDERHDLDTMEEWYERRVTQAMELWREAYGEEMPADIIANDNFGVAISRAIIERNGGMRNFAGVDALSDAERTLLTEVSDGIRRMDMQMADIRERALARQRNTSRTNWSDYKLGGGHNYREYLFKMPGSDYRNRAMDVHWKGETGVLAHARLQDFDTKDGKILFVEEIQSDWHNQGNATGYQGEATREQLAAAHDEHMRIYNELSNLHDVVSDELTDYADEQGFANPEYFVQSAMQKGEEFWNLVIDTYPAELSNKIRHYLKLKAEEQQARRKTMKLSTALNSGVPDAPFKQNYHEFVLKRLIREAAEKGYDYIGWTSGKLQENRWSTEYAEGYRIEYDQDIPKFMSKFGKKFGATAYRAELKGNPIWRMPITDTMKNSVLYEGQPMYSLSEQGELFAPIGKNDVFGRDFRKEEIAPITDNATPNTGSVLDNASPVLSSAPVSEEIGPVSEESVMFPDDMAPIESELERLRLEESTMADWFLEWMPKADFTKPEIQQEYERMVAKYDSTAARIKELEQESNAADAERLWSAEEKDAPPETENTQDEMADAVELSKNAVTEISRSVRKLLGLGNQQMKDARALIEKYSHEQFPDRERLYEEVQERFGTYTEKYVDEQLKEVKKQLRTYGIKVDPFIKSQIADYGQLQKRNFGKVRFSKEGLAVDAAYKEFQELLPGYFPESIDVPTDQLMHIIKVANMDTEFTEKYDIDTDTLEQATDAIINGVNDYKHKKLLQMAHKQAKEAAKTIARDEYAPIDLEAALRSRRPTVGVPMEDLAPTFDTNSGQQAMFEDAEVERFEDAEVERKITRSELHQNIMDNMKNRFAAQGYDLDEVLKNAKNLSTFATVDNTPQRVMEKALGWKEGKILSDLTVDQVARNESEGIRWLNSFTDRKKGVLAQISKKYNIKPGSKESKAAQMYAEGFYVAANDEIISYGDRELAMDFPDAQVQRNIKGLAKDPQIRQIYDDTLAAINESRKRNAYPEIPRLDNYFLHFRAMEDTFSRLGLPFNPNDIRAKDLPTDLNGVTADLKPGQPYFASAKHRTGKRTTFDLLGGLEMYLSSAKNQIYHIDDIQTLRALRNYIADDYGQAKGLESIDSLSEEEAQQKIEAVYNSHLSTFAKFLNEEANVIAGKTALTDRGLEGIIGRRGITFLESLNRQVGANMVGFNVSSAGTNFLSVVQAAAKTNKFDVLKAFTQTVASKVSRKPDAFIENNPTVIRRKGAESFHRTPWQKAGDAGYFLMSAVDNISTELIVRAKYNELTRKGMSEQEAIAETDKWVSRMMGDRSLGQQPQLYNSKMLGMITKFQLEVRNQLDAMVYDTIQETKAANENIPDKMEKNAKTAAKVTSTFVQLAVLQHLFGKAFESVAGYNPAFDIISAIIKAFGWDDDEESEDTVLDNIEQGFLELLGDLPYTSTLTGGRIPIASALPIEQFVTGKDSYGNEKSRWETLAEAAPYYLLPGGYGQAKKTVQGLKMFDDDLPIAGSYTDSGNLRFPVEDTLGNRVQAAIFGQWASENARDYFDNEWAPLKENQIEEFAELGISIEEYRKIRKDLGELDTLGEKAVYIAGLDLPMDKKNLLINNIADREEPIDLTGLVEYGDFGEFEYAKKYPTKYAFLQDNGISYDQYKSFDEDTREAWNWAYENPDKFTVSKVVAGDVSVYRQYTKYISKLSADKDEEGKSISGSKKEKVVEYINNLDMEYGQKIIFFKSQYPADDTYNYEIVDYLSSRDDVSYEEAVTILKALGFEVHDDGRVTWD